MQANHREYLMTNSFGSFGMGCWDRVPRRKYHGLWISRALGGERPEHLLLDVLERANSLPLVNYDFGHGAGRDARALISRFERMPVPLWTYEMPNAGLLARSLSFIGAEDPLRPLEGIEVKYEWSGSDASLSLSLAPLFSIRSLHSLAKENLALDGAIRKVKARPTAAASGWSIYEFQPYADFCAIQIAAKGPSKVQADVEIEGAWYKNFFYREEDRRGYPAQEDCFCPMHFVAEMPPRSTMTLKFMLPGNPHRRTRPSAKTSQPIQIAGPHAAFADDLRQALNAFVYVEAQSPRFESVIAGYPWFSSWARDTFISLPGLSLAWGDPERALALLKNWIPSLEDSLFRRATQATEPTEGRPPGLNSTGLDSPFLWGAALRFLVEGHPHAAAPDEPQALALMNALERWIVYIFQGESPHLSVTDFGLLCVPRPDLAGGAASPASSWMDAVIDGVPVTPRHGYPIEINALFFDGMDFLLRRKPNIKAATARLFRRYLENARPVFGGRFWVQERGFVGDCHNGMELDGALRPNMLRALGANFEIFSQAQREASLQRATEELLTPFGLRTLSPLDSRYCGAYLGGPNDRDRSYHQGTAWPWLIESFTEAALKTWNQKKLKKRSRPSSNP